MMISLPGDMKRVEAIRKAVRGRAIGDLTFEEYRSIERMFGPLGDVSPKDLSIAEGAILRLEWGDD
jgi:hypothetical protein